MREQQRQPLLVWKVMREQQRQRKLAARGLTGQQHQQSELAVWKVMRQVIRYCAACYDGQKCDLLEQCRPKAMPSHFFWGNFSHFWSLKYQSANLVFEPFSLVWMVFHDQRNMLRSDRRLQVFQNLCILVLCTAPRWRVFLTEHRRHLRTCKRLDKGQFSTDAKNTHFSTQTSNFRLESPRALLRALPSVRLHCKRLRAALPRHTHILTQELDTFRFLRNRGIDPFKCSSFPWSVGNCLKMRSVPTCRGQYRPLSWLDYI